VIEFTNFAFFQPAQEVHPNPSNSMQIFDVGDAHIGWLKAALRCKSLPVADRNFWRVRAINANQQIRT
jgi:hypothetical protein